MHRILLATLLLASACSTSPAPLGPPDLPAPGGQAPRSVAQLLAYEPVLRPSDGGGPAVARGWADGIDDIRHAALFHPTEDGWAFIEGPQGPRWKNIGHAEGKRWTQFRIDPKDPDLVGATRLTVIHFHPAEVVYQRLEKLYRSLEGDGYDLPTFWAHVKRTNQTRFASPPSLPDFTTDARLSLGMRRRLGLEVRSVVVTAAGDYTYRAGKPVIPVLVQSRTGASQLWQKLRQGITGHKQYLQRLNQTGFEVVLRKTPGDPWQDLRLWFQLRLYRQRHGSGPPPPRPTPATS